MQLEPLDGRKPCIGASLSDVLADNNYNSESEATEFVPNFDADGFCLEPNNKRIINASKAYGSSIPKLVTIPPPVP